MPVLTPDQLKAIAAKLLLVEQAIDAYLNSPAGQALSDSQQNSLATQRDQLGDEVEDITSEGITIALDDAAGAVSALNVVTKDIKSDITHIGDVQKIVNLAGAALTLTAAILATPVSAGAIVAAIPAVVSAVKAITDGDQ